MRPLLLLLLGFLALGAPHAMAAEASMEASDADLSDRGTRDAINRKSEEIAALGKRQDEESERQLMDFLQNSSYHHRLRTSAIHALRERQSQAAVQPMLAILKDPQENRYVRFTSATTLATLKAEASLPALRDALRDQDAFVRQGAATALGMFGAEAKDAAPELAALARGDGNPKVRREAAGALEHLGVTEEEVLSSLLKALEDEDDWVRIYAAGALGRMGKAAAPAVPVMLGQIPEASSASVVEYYAKALANLGDVAARQAAPVMEGLLDRREANIRAAAVYALGTFGPEAKPSHEKIIARLKDEAELVRMNAALAVGNLKLEAAIPSLREMLTSPRTDNDKLGALAALSAIATPEAARLVREAYGVKDE